MLMNVRVCVFDGGHVVLCTGEALHFCRLNLITVNNKTNRQHIRPPPPPSSRHEAVTRSRFLGPDAEIRSDQSGESV